VVELLVEDLGVEAVLVGAEWSSGGRRNPAVAVTIASSTVSVVQGTTMNPLTPTGRRSMNVSMSVGSNRPMRTVSSRRRAFYTNSFSPSATAGLSKRT
jgi:hypothetical protein